MSADFDFQMGREKLIASAAKYTACARFREVEGGRRGYCEDCHQSEAAHVVVALRGTCGDCAHANPEDYDSPSMVGCTLAGGFYQCQAMLISARCAEWAPKA